MLVALSSTAFRRGRPAIAADGDRRRRCHQRRRRRRHRRHHRCRHHRHFLAGDDETLFFATLAIVAFSYRGRNDTATRA